MYYFASTKNFDKDTILYPRIPENRSIDEDEYTPRICVSQSINGCLTAIADNILENDVVYIYQCKSRSVRQPSLDEVPDAFITGEQWVLKPIKINLFFTVKIKKRIPFYVNELMETIMEYDVIS